MPRAQRTARKTNGRSTDVLAVRVPRADGEAFRALADGQGVPYGRLLHEAVRHMLSAS